MPWLVTRYGKDIASGDGVISWLSGKEAGMYATAEVIEPAQFLTQTGINKSKLSSNLEQEPHPQPPPPSGECLRLP
jgi:hypothetical protein